MPIAKKSAPKKAAAGAGESLKKKAAKTVAAEEAPKAKKPSKKTGIGEAAVKTPVPKKQAKKASGIEFPIGLPPLAEAILSAIREGRAVEFLFKDADANAPRTFEPRQLLFDALAQAWFVFGWDRRYNAERYHRLDLLEKVNAVEGVGRGAQGPFAEGTPGNQIGGWLGGEPISVKATLQKQWVFAVKQAPPPFPKFHLADKEDGRAEASFIATDLRAIARWIMQFGDGITVQEPQRLGDRLRQVASVWGGKDLAKTVPFVPAPAPRYVVPEPREERPRHVEPKADQKGSKVEVRVERL